MGKDKKALAIIYSDVHLDLYHKYNKGYTRTLNGISVMKEVKLKAKLLKVPTLFAGDLISKEKFISNRLLSLILPPLYKIWGSEKYPTIGITGNHDQCDENTLEYTSPSYVKTFSEIFKGLFCIDNYSMDYGKLRIHGIPYLTHNLGLHTAIKERIKAIDSKQINILLLHTTLPGSQDNDGREQDSNISKRTMKLLKKFDIVFVGHIHKPMKLGKNVYQVGAPNHQRKTDREQDLGYCILYNDLSVEYIHLDKYPKFVELDYEENNPDTKNYYYNKSKVKVANSDKIGSYSDTTNHVKLAKTYIKEKGIKDKAKKRALINILK